MSVFARCYGDEEEQDPVPTTVKLRNNQKLRSYEVYAIGSKCYEKFTVLWEHIWRIRGLELSLRGSRFLN